MPMVTINNQVVPMEVDTGAAVSLMSKEMQSRLFPAAVLKKSSIRLNTYTSQSYCGSHELVIVSGKGSTLFGRD